MNILKNKKIYLLFLIIFFGFLLVYYFNNQKVQAVSSPDAIAVRVLPNESHVGIERWYNEQGFTGSPQTLKVDGYNAIRDGRTVYVAAANATGQNLFTNIYLISYNQNQEQETIDIFGQILAHWKFNSNITTTGVCSQDNNIACNYDSECSFNGYCTSQKSRITRDVKRMADLMEIIYAVENYQEINGQYPDLSSGTYIPGATISTWPSWQETFKNKLGVSINNDPINKMGSCPGYSSDTCWNEENKVFDGIIPNDLPGGTRAYAYYSNRGYDYNVCTILETATTYANIQNFNCFDASIDNRPPEIINVNLHGFVNQEFKGNVEAVDQDGDWLNYQVDLINPSPDEWTSENYKWVWDQNYDKFKINNTFIDSQKEIHAVLAGNANCLQSSCNNLYQIRITVDDGRGGIDSGEYEVFIEGQDMSINNNQITINIGQSGTLSLSGLDASGHNITDLNFLDATLDGVDLNDINSYGFSLQGMDLNIAYTPNQVLGQYVINVYAEDPTTLKEINSYFTVDIVNSPPDITSVVMNYSDNSSCVLGSGCDFEIDNGENASINVNADDPDSISNLQYYFVNDDDLGGKISIDNTSGVITGFNNLNFQGLDDQIFTINVRVEDGFCQSLNMDECSDTETFDVLVREYCSMATPNSFYSVNLPGPYTINSSGESFAVNGINNCSSIWGSSVDVNYHTYVRSKVIVFVIDLSYSMNTNVDGTPAIDQIKQLLLGNGSVLDDLYNSAINLPNGYSIRVGLVGYNGSTYIHNIVDISDPGELQSLKNRINNYSTGAETNTLLALNQAEIMLNPITDSNTDKIIVLMSDGVPAIDQETTTYTCAPTTCGCAHRCQSFLDIYHGCYSNSLDECCAPGRSYCDNIDRCCDDTNWDACCYPAPPPPLPGGGGMATESCVSHDQCKNTSNSVWPDCHERCYDQGFDCGYCIDCHNSCPQCGGCGACHAPLDCGIFGCSDANCCRCNPGGSAYNSEADFKIAVTSQTQCLPIVIGGNLDCYSNNCAGTDEDNTTSYNCDINSDVNIEANAIKNNGIDFYTIYYNTQGVLAPRQLMCDWSSDTNCSSCLDANASCGGDYAFSGTNVEQMFDNVISEIMNKPKDVTLNSVDIDDPEPYNPNNTVPDTDINNVFTCNPFNAVVNVDYSGNGYLEFSNIKFNYCPALLHP